MDFKELDKLKTELDKQRPLSLELMEIIDEKFKIEWTYNSNAIEGNTLTLQETSFFLQHGLTSKGKTLKEYLEVKNHADAIEFIEEIIKENRKISEGLIKELHALLLKGIDYIMVGPSGSKRKKHITPGMYKKEPNHVLTMNGDLHKYCEPILVPEEMEKLIYFINNSNKHPIEISAIAHHRFVAIHPFDDGNGRVARILMNLILMKNGYVPVVIRNENREEYYRALMEADKGNLTEFINLVANEEKKSLELILNVIRDFNN
ncbi:Fic family protein [Desulfitibacter alkalitolerans]|uniref:Fic family protein n=1 Tax=Desulfitibacter alkalitolerans TaxID=264641 RepID=UPI0004821FEF|nr:Fic family protein [Desulfitibacter alkalitolerans]